MSDVQNSQFFVWDIETLDLSSVVSVDSIPWEFTFNNENEDLLYIGSESVIYVYNTDGFSFVKSIPNHEAGSIYALRCTEDYIVSGGSNSAIVIQNHDGGIVKAINKHVEPISAIELHSDYLITGDFSGLIYIHLLSTFAEYAKLAVHENWIRTIEVFSSGEIMVTVSHDKKCIF